jgi:hypothetical protein
MGSEGNEMSDEYPFGATLDEMDLSAFFNMRDWLTEALEAKGAKRIGGGIGLGQADIDIDLDGYRYNVSIRPLKNCLKSDTAATPQIEEMK